MKNKDKTVRLNYHLKQLIPLTMYLIVIATLLCVKIWLAGYEPLTSSQMLKDSRSTLKGMEASIQSLNSEKRSTTEDKKNLEENIEYLKQKREREGSLRFYTTNLPAYCRYVEFRANATNIEVVDVDIESEENKVNYTLLGEYNEIVSLMKTLETREIYYVENFEIMPSFSNKGSYVKFTANFNLEDTIVSRYEKKLKYDEVESGNTLPSNEGGESDNEQISY